MRLLPLLLLTLVAAPASFALPLPADPAQVGRWDAPFAWPVQAEDVALLPTGEILAFLAGPDAVLWNVTTGAFTPVPAPDALNCAGLALLADGRVLVNGGHSTLWHGAPSTWLFDPWNRSWERTGDMQVGRYYPTAITLADGRVLTVSGNGPDGADAPVPEVWDGDAWTLLPSAALTMEFYPRLHALPDGRIARAGQDAAAAVLDPATWTWSEGPVSSGGRRWGGAAAPLDLDTLLVMGGGSMGFSSEGGHGGGVFRDAPSTVADNVANGRAPATATAEIWDFATTRPTLRETANMLFARRDLSAVALPDGDVLAVGGAPGFEPVPGWTEHALAPELYDARSGAWRLMAASDRHRGYHSTALLLPDGRVLSAGGDFETGAGAIPGAEHTGQLFAPPYLFRGERPVILEAPAALARGETFQPALGGDVERLVLARMGTSTHSVDSDQRIVPLAWDGVVATVPAEPGATPPGWYMLFALGPDGTPSHAAFVRVS